MEVECLMVRRSRLRVFEHVERMAVCDWVKRVRELTIVGKVLRETQKNLELSGSEGPQLSRLV